MPPDNPFAFGGAGVQYARGRPYHHPRTLTHAFAMLGEPQVERALDVACGTGMSTLALRDRAAFVVGADRSAEMLGVAPSGDGITYVFSAAERLPFADSTFGGITCCSGVHWFDQARFFAEAARVLEPSGWIALYDHYFVGKMVGVPEFGRWVKMSHDRYPLPDRTPQVGDPRAQTPDGYVKIGDEFFADDITMTHSEFVEYQLSISNFVAAVERGTSRDEMRSWLLDSTESFFAGVESRVVPFLASVTCLRVAEQTP
jgi:ubiquinone/menaquinone biosynthesis C-methylase UbiE